LPRRTPHSSRSSPATNPDLLKTLPSLDTGRRLRIGIVTEYYYPHLGGICEHVHFFAHEARARGHHVDIITSNLPGAMPEPHVIRIGRSQPVYMNQSQARITIGRGIRKQVSKVLRLGRYDILHVHSPLTPVLPLLAIEEATCPVVGTFHTYFERSLTYATFGPYFQKRLDMMSAAIAVSSSTTVMLNKYFSADWLVIPNGIDTDLFHPAAPLPPGMERDVPTILFLGRFDPRNGLSTLIESFRRVKGRQREARLVVVGDGPLRGHYYKQARGLKDITFVGSVLQGRPSYYANSTVYACPTTKASFGITLLEAMACETPIVCSDILGFRDVVADGREALMVPSGDRDAIADALVQVLESPSLARRLGATGRANALDYSWSSVTTQVLEVYQSVLGGVRVVA
jgi:phosphatidyl-myo-inositol alpha-mannosyltransferase